MNETQNYSTIQVTQETDDRGWLKALTFRWIGESEYVVISKPLLDDPIFPHDTHLGGSIILGPFEMRIVSFNNYKDSILLEMTNNKKKDVYYYGSVENKWNWTELEEI